VIIKLTDPSIVALRDIITGDTEVTPYRSGPKLVDLFNQFGEQEIYGEGFPSRWAFADEKIRKLNGTEKLEQLIETILDERLFLNTEFDYESVINFLNKNFLYDGFELIKSNGLYKVVARIDELIDVENPFENSGEINHQFISEQIQKCNEKIVNEDYNGAITNAKSLLEAILKEILNDFQSTDDLPKLFKSTLKLLDLEPGRTDIAESLKKVMSGLISVVGGVATMRNKMGDAHATNFAPKKHHAKLAVNSVNTLANFLLDQTENDE